MKELTDEQAEPYLKAYLAGQASAINPCLTQLKAKDDLLRKISRLASMPGNRQKAIKHLIDSHLKKVF